MIQIIAFSIVLLAGLYLMLLGLAALVRPSLAKTFLLGFATTRAKHYAELVARLIIGGSLLKISSEMPYPFSFKLFGWVLVATTLLMALLPWATHKEFAKTSVPRALRHLPLIGIASLGLGSLMVWSTWRGYAA